MLEATLGIDTSCYTTSVALAARGKIVASQRQLLYVPDGERGLRQSEAVFQHIKTFPELLKKLLTQSPETTIGAICVSESPRNTQDSYMPVFQCGKAFAEAIALASGIPIYYTSHQQGHIRAALVDSGMPKGNFIAVHLSGGTTQSLLVDEKLIIQEIGGTNDLNAGQLVDRIGVYMGLGFPAGPQLEQLAVNGHASAVIRLSKDGERCSFSGAENGIKKLLKDGAKKEDAAREVYSFLARSLFHIILSAVDSCKIENVLLAGGVASSKLLREMLTERVEKKHKNINLFWAKPELSSDNACGVALIGEERRMEAENGQNH